MKEKALDRVTRIMAMGRVLSSDLLNFLHFASLIIVYTMIVGREYTGERFASKVENLLMSFSDLMREHANSWVSDPNLFMPERDTGFRLPSAQESLDEILSSPERRAEINREISPLMDEFVQIFDELRRKR